MLALNVGWRALWRNLRNPNATVAAGIAPGAERKCNPAAAVTHMAAEI